ncbi:MAG: D-alanyl-D-alanine carboxypeptidase [Akkermansiaceae bacterium]|nr:D-alanyl-D-alanine carboxypeptidase [Akkermansiaceae bacterium]
MIGQWKGLLGPGLVLGTVVQVTGGGALKAAESVAVVEAHSGRILLAENATKRRPVASLTKVATAKVVLDWAKLTGAELGGMATVPVSAGTLGGANPMGLQAGDRISLRNALYSALLGSDNVAAHTLADHVGTAIVRARGGNGDPVKAFVDEMNSLGKAIGMKHTKFMNAHGMDNAKERGKSTALDMARLCIYAMRDAGFVFFVKQGSRKISFDRGGGAVEFQVKNTNKLLGEMGINGIKTGMTALAGECLATSSGRKPLVTKLPDGRSRVTSRELICVVLGSADRFGRTRVLVPQGWELYDRWMADGGVVENPARELLAVPNPR